MRRRTVRGLLGALIALVLFAPGHGNIASAQAQPAVPGVEGWARVLTVTNKWLVLQDDKDREYPVAFDSIRTFVVRRPMSPDAIPDGALVETTGPEAGGSALSTDHVDVYEGASRSLVSPIFLYVNASGRIITPLEFTYNIDAYGDPFPGLGNPIQGGVLSGPNRVHLVAPVISRAPLLVGLMNNQRFGILPPQSGVMTATSITPGRPDLVKPGDLAYFYATGMGPRSLALAQLVIYKTGP